jgi:hypothetical protein
MLVRRLRPRDTIVGIQYFTAMVKNDPPAEARQRTYIDALVGNSSVPIEVVLGRFQQKPMTCKTCGATWMSYEEKETDINISSRLIADAAARRSDIALLISADSDLCPAIRSARRVSAAAGGQLGIIVAFPPRRRSLEVASVATAFNISDSKLRNSQLPATVQDPKTGSKYHRPPHWS